MDARVISAFTRVHSPSKTGVNALEDALLPAHDAARALLRPYRACAAARSTEAAVWPNRMARSSAVRMPPMFGLTAFAFS